MIKNQEETTLFKLLNAFEVYGKENFQINSTVIGPTEELDVENMFYIMKDVIALGHNHEYDDTKFIPRCTMELPVSLDPFTARFENMLVGWSAQLTFAVDNTNDVCLIPMS